MHPHQDLAEAQEGTSIRLGCVFMITVPASFREMPRWAYDSEGRAWLDEVSQAVAAQCRTWGLTVDGPPLHGSNALVIPVKRREEALALRMAPPGDDVAQLERDLRLWDTRGTVRLIEADLTHRALLLERLDADRSLLDVP